MTVSMGKDVIMSHIARVTRDIIGGDEQFHWDVDVAAEIFKLGKLSPVVDTVTGEVFGYEWKIVVKKHVHPVKPAD